MAPCTHSGMKRLFGLKAKNSLIMKRLFCLKAKNALGRFAPSALPHYNSSTAAVDYDAIILERCRETK